MTKAAPSLQITSTQEAVLAAGRVEGTRQPPRGKTFLDSFLPKLKGLADNMNHIAEDSVAGAANISERFLLRASAGVERGKEWTEATKQGMDSFGKRVDEKGDFKEWEFVANDMFPDTLASVKQSGEWVENLAPLTAAGLVAGPDAEQSLLASGSVPVESAEAYGKTVEESATVHAQVPAAGAAVRGASTEADIEDVKVAVDVVAAEPAKEGGAGIEFGFAKPATDEVVVPEHESTEKADGAIVDVVAAPDHDCVQKASESTEAAETPPAEIETEVVKPAAKDGAVLAKE